MRTAPGDITSRFPEGMPKNKQAALLLIRQLEAQISSTCEGADTLLSDAFAEFIHEKCNEHSLKPNTIRDYVGALEKFLGYVGPITVGGLSGEIVRQFFNEAVARGRWAAVGSGIWSCWNWLECHGYRGIASTLPARKPVARQRTRYLSDVEYDALWAAIELAQIAGWITSRTADALRVAILVPLRRGELVILRWDEFDLANKCLILSDSKSGRRIIPISNMACAAIGRQPRINRYVFADHRKNGHICPNALRKALDKVIVRTKCIEKRGFCFHSLRHSWASRAIRRGVPLEHVRRIMGHSTTWMAIRYAHMAAPELHDSVAIAMDGIGDDT